MEKTAEELRKHGVSVTATLADVTKAGDVQRVIEITIKQLSRIDILVNSAGDIWFGHSVDTTDEQWQYCMDVNLYSAVRFTRGVVPHMRKQGGGRIITGSVKYFTLPHNGQAPLERNYARQMAFVVCCEDSHARSKASSAAWAVGVCQPRCSSRPG